MPEDNAGKKRLCQIIVTAFCFVLFAGTARSQGSETAEAEVPPAPEAPAEAPAAPPAVSEAPAPAEGETAEGETAPSAVDPSPDPVPPEPDAKAPGSEPAEPGCAAKECEPASSDMIADLLKSFAWAKNVKVAGFGVLWGRVTEPAAEGEDPRADFRLRFARIIVKAQPHEKVEVKAILAFDNANTLFDYTLTWKVMPFLQVTAGQFLLPMGGQVSIVAKNAVMMDRPTYVFKLTKKRFRDIGVMLHSGDKSILDGLVNYQLVVANGTGVGFIGTGEIAGNVTDLLFLGRTKLNVAPLFLGKKDQLTLGVTYAITEDPAQNTGVAADDKKAAADRLGTSFTPYGAKRLTQLFGADLAVSMYDFWLQTELMYLHSSALDASATTDAYGANLDVAYRVAAIATQFAGRVEVFDPDLSAPTNEVYDVTAGANYEPVNGLQLSAFLGGAMTAAGLADGGKPVFRLDTRMKVMF